MVCFVDLFYLFIYLIKVRLSYVIFFIWFLYWILFDIYHRVEEKFLDLMIYILYFFIYLKSLIFIALFCYLYYIFILFIKQDCLINFFICPPSLPNHFICMSYIYYVILVIYCSVVFTFSNPHVQIVLFFRVNLPSVEHTSVKCETGWPWLLG